MGVLLLNRRDDHHLKLSTIVFSKCKSLSSIPWRNKSQQALCLDIHGQTWIQHSVIWWKAIHVCPIVKRKHVAHVGEYINILISKVNGKKMQINMQLCPLPPERWWLLQNWTLLFTDTVLGCHLLKVWGDVKHCTSLSCYFCMNYNAYCITKEKLLAWDTWPFCNQTRFQKIRKLETKKILSSAKCHCSFTWVGNHIFSFILG